MMKIPLFALVAIVATLHLSLAQQNDSSSDGHHHQPPNFFGIPLPFQIPQFQFPQLPFFREEQAGGPPADAPTDAQASEQQGQDGQDHQDRFFFGVFHPISTLVTCNGTTQSGASCTSCTQALTCGSSHVGRLTTCRGFFPYCNLGRCSLFPGELCANSTTG